jgi:hypothetical protein
MQLFFDIDGVLLNFERAFVGFLNRTYGMSLPERYETGSWFFEDLLTPQEMRDRWQAFLDAEDSGRMEALVAPERFNALTGGHTVHLLTNFPFPYMEKRMANLAALGLDYETLDFCGLHSYRGTVPPTKADVVGRLHTSGNGGLFIDDHPENCMDVVRNCREVEVWLMSRYFNRDFGHPGVRRAQDWKCLFERLGENGAGEPADEGAPGRGA